MEREPSSLRWDSNVWLWVLHDSDHWQIALQITDPSSRQREHSKTRSKKIVRQKKNLVMDPRGVPGTKMDRPTDRQSQHQLNFYFCISRLDSRSQNNFNLQRWIRIPPLQSWVVGDNKSKREPISLEWQSEMWLWVLQDCMKTANIWQ
jgi:hypothetical protein